MRPGYGYVGLPDPNADKLAPDDSGIFLVDLDTSLQGTKLLTSTNTQALHSPVRPRRLEQRGRDCR